MNNHRAYEIAFVGLKPGVHTFDYKVSDKFFADYGQQDFDNCDVSIKLTLEKNASLLLLKFDIAGTVNVLCDRCANTIVKDLWDEFNMVVKMVENPDEMNNQEEDPDIYYIKYNESHLHIADWIYEFVNLSIPAQRNCGEDEQGGSKCNPEVLKKLDQMKADAQASTHNVWKDLDKLKDLEEEADLN
ncbi:YceD family protein [Arachidicoccus sp.]|uniref:YceD family protein n=1 Tax=Arachidicoccus sp. TaxID=1872624 RepID=UPI003D1D8645